MTVTTIDHIAMYVDNLEYSKQFFEKYFNGTAGKLYHNTNTGFKSYFISFGNKTRLELMNRPDLLQNDKSKNHTGYSHIAFNLGSKDAVDNLTNQFKADGFTITSNPRTTGDGYYESVILDLEGNLIELTI